MAERQEISHDFSLVRYLMKKRASIVLDSDKDYLISARLGGLAIQEGLETIEHLLVALREIPDGPLAQKVVEALTTNETSFFRDGHPFEALKKAILPEIIAKNAPHKKLRIWSAACSSGQEPYSLAITLCENFPELMSWDIKIVASDISVKMVERTINGLYSKAEVERGLNRDLVRRYFGETEDGFLVNASLKKLIEPRVENLCYANSLMFDIIFLRNVLIYFNDETKRNVVTKVVGALNQDGYIFFGSAEAVLNISSELKQQTIGKTICYKKT